MPTTPHLIPAPELRRGDIVLDHAGERLFAAYDLDASPGDAITVWTAIRDQEAGQPPRLAIPATALLAIAPRAV